MKQLYHIVIEIKLRFCQSQVTHLGWLHKPIFSNVHFLILTTSKQDFQTHHRHKNNNKTLTDQLILSNH